MLHYSPKRSQSHREPAKETPPKRDHPRNRSSSPLLRLIRYPSSSSPKKSDAPSVEPVLSRAEALRIIEKVSARSRRPVTPASPTKDSPSFPFPKSWKTTPAPASSTKPSAASLLSSGHRSSSSPRVRLTDTNDRGQLSTAREAMSPPVSVYNTHDDPFRISPRPNQVPFVASPPNLVPLSNNPNPVIKTNLPRTQVGAPTTIASSSSLLRVPRRGRSNIRTLPSAQTHTPLSDNPVISLRQTGPAVKPPGSSSVLSAPTSRSPSSEPDHQIASHPSEKHIEGVKDSNSRSVLGSRNRADPENDTSPSSLKLDRLVPRTSSPSLPKASEQHQILHVNTQRRPLEPLIIPTISHHQLDSSPSASSWSASNPGNIQRLPANALGIHLPSKTNIIPDLSVDQGSPSRKETLGDRSTLPSPTKNPSRRHGLIYGSADAPFPCIRRSPSVEIVSEIKSDETTPSIEFVSSIWNAIPEREKSGLPRSKDVDVEVSTLVTDRQMNLHNQTVV